MLSTMERVLILRSADIFATVEGEDLAPLAMAAEEVRFAEGEALFREAEPGDSLHVLVNGDVSVEAEGAGRVAVRHPGTVIGEMSVLSGRPRSATCVAISELLTLRLRRDDFLEMLAERPALALAVIQVLTQRLDEAIQRPSPGGGR